ncbi:endogenous retrovirus group K member 8 Gag polyprotein-like [Lutra lutra]|uniref:endogenous retrovirus group K member 8 Gag polyprotein-like n=1 Tax=Lutra lutra TaxID=9657 RepID=UPI001FD2976C|nr:endogenous retrovirus group K member 8 Gag polyprotein-like [Lutra lutra]
MGPSAPYTIQVVKMVASQWLTPHDWHQTAKSTLTPGDYVVWRTEYEDKCKETVQRYSGKRGFKITLDMLLGTGAYLTPVSQIKLTKAVLKEVTTNAVLAWRAIPPPGAKKTVLAGIKQGNEEPYADFVSRLEEALNRMMPHCEGTDILLKQLAWENANSLCQDLIRPLRRTGTVQEYIKACIDASPAVVQGMAYAAAMKGQKYTAFVRQTYGNGKRPNGQANQGLTCFSCGNADHMKKDCLKGTKEVKKPPPGVCPRCKKGKHWKNECRSKFDKEGNRLDEESKEEDSKNE